MRCQSEAVAYLMMTVALQHSLARATSRGRLAPHARRRPTTAGATAAREPQILGQAFDFNIVPQAFVHVAMPHSAQKSPRVREYARSISIGYSLQICVVARLCVRAPRRGDTQTATVSETPTRVSWDNSVLHSSACKGQQC